MPRGRPAGSKNKPKDNIVKTDIFSEQPIITEVENKPEIQKDIKLNNTASYKNDTYCDRCSSVIHCGANVAHLTSLVGKADWHRNCSKERLLLCDDCAMELNNMIDKWVINKNPSLNKWKLNS